MVTRERRPWLGDSPTLNLEVLIIASTWSRKIVIDISKRVLWCGDKREREHTNEQTKPTSTNLKVK